MDSSELEKKLKLDAISQFEVAVSQKIDGRGELPIIDMFANQYLDMMAKIGLLEKSPYPKVKGAFQYSVTQKGVDFFMDIEQKKHEIFYGAWGKILGE